MSGDATGPAPETRSPRFLGLLFGACAAPLAWLGQMMLAYCVSAYACFPGDHPVGLPVIAPLLSLLILFDLAAVAVCGAGGFVSWRAWRRGCAGRNRFLALWGVMSSLWFAAAVLFNITASLMVPLCQN